MVSTLYRSLNEANKPQAETTPSVKTMAPALYTFNDSLKKQTQSHQDKIDSILDEMLKVVHQYDELRVKYDELGSQYEELRNTTRAMTVNSETTAGRLDVLSYEVREMKQNNAKLLHKLYVGFGMTSSRHWRRTVGVSVGNRDNRHYEEGVSCIANFTEQAILSPDLLSTSVLKS